MFDAIVDYPILDNASQRDYVQPVTTAPTREAIESGPYLEGFKARGLEVIFFFEPIDEYVCEAIREFSGKKLVSADSADLELPDAPDAENRESLSDSEAEDFSSWMKETLGDAVEKVTPSNRLVDSWNSPQPVMKNLWPRIK